VRVTALTIAAVLFGGLVVVAPEVPAGARPAPPAFLEASIRVPSGPPVPRPSGAKPHAAGGRAVPSAAAMRAAWEYAEGRGGLVSFASVNTEGELRGRAENRRYSSASVVKSMLLAAELRRLKQAGQPLDSQTDALLGAMIMRSDNEAADQIYERVGDGGLELVAHRAGMRRFTVAGHWGNAQITAADMALMFGDLDRVLVERHREYALGLLGSIVPEQSWGIPQAAGERWAVRFKGGWLPDHALAHQAAELRERRGPRELSLAILTDEQPSHEYAVETIRGIAARLLERR
jgi:hypothetical protein